jgi:hypothetical protein
MTHSVVSEITRQLNLLRSAQFSCVVEERAHLSPNVYFCWDKQSAQVDIMASSGAGDLLSAEIKVKGTPQWFTLNFGLGSGTFAKGDTLGLVLQGSASPTADLHPFVRSVEDGGDRNDTLLADSARLGANTSQSVILHEIEAHEPLAWAKKFHTLIIPLPKHDFTLKLMDMRVFSIEAAETGALRAKTLASAAS